MVVPLTLLAMEWAIAIIQLLDHATKALTLPPQMFSIANCIITSTSYNSDSNNGNRNFDIVSLNNAFLSLSKNMKFIYNMVRSVCSPPNGDSSVHFSNNLTYIMNISGCIRMI